MGLIKTTLSPLSPNVLGVELSQIEGPKVLEAAVQTHLCGLIDMLSEITVRSNEIFSGILQETKVTVARFDKISARVNALTAQMPQIDEFFQTTSYDSMSHNSRAYYHPKLVISSRMLTPASRSPALQETYEKCRKPPALEKMDSLNDVPGTSCLKLYSDPEFFEAEWIIEMEKQREAAKAKKKERKKKRAETALEKKATSSVKVEAKPVMRARYDPHTGQRIDTVERGSSSSNLTGSNSSSNLMERAPSQSGILQPTVSPRAAPPAPVERNASTPNFSAPPTTPRKPAATGSLTHGQAKSMSTPEANRERGASSSSHPPVISPRAAPQVPGQTGQHRAPPSTPSSHPPPPVHHAPPPSSAPPPFTRGNLPPPVHHSPPPAAPPPPPAAPPPPPPSAPAPPPPPSSQGGSLAAALAAKGGSLRPTEDQKAKPVDAQSELLGQIRKGMNLKKTDQQAAETEKKEVVENSVAAILARRIAIADSDDDDDGSESDEWSD